MWSSSIPLSWSRTKTNPIPHTLKIRFMKKNTGLAGTVTRTTLASCWWVWDHFHPLITLMPIIKSLWSRNYQSGSPLPLPCTQKKSHTSGFFAGLASSQGCLVGNWKTFFSQVAYFFHEDMASKTTILLQAILLWIGSTLVNQHVYSDIMLQLSKAEFSKSIHV